ncbi:DENN domain-containing protein 2D isoform X3 [Panthera uncia]|uniref:DENN domain-containing protein 2D isoform X3 n=1 Tax=Panthera uncia TaxID=29064 RepID=UPI0020FFA71E|nr:DENN domain-containing protein 2D isoform X3 [Panthera uncia]
MPPHGGGLCGHRHVALGPVLLWIHVRSGLTLSGTGLGTCGWAQSLPLGHRASQVAPQSLSLASKSVASVPLLAPWVFKSPRAGTETAQLVLTLLQALRSGEASGDLSVGLAAPRCTTCREPHRLHLGHGLRRYQVGSGVLVSGSRQDNLREAVKEPERAPEHCLSTFAGGQHFFEYLFVVSLKKKSSGHDYEPTITYQFPKRENLLRGQQEEEERLLSAIPLFCFPDGNEWAPLTEYPRETFSFVLTNVDGSRKIGYCRRLLPAGRGPRLPKVYCIISCIGCFGLFSKILDEVEKRHQISVAVIYPFMQGLREAAFPAPGKTVTLKSFIPDSGTEFISLTRPLDSHLEHVDFRSLLRCLRFEQILQIFASAVLERRIIFLAEDLSTLSQCIHAAAALLYPFSWAHTYIPVVPESLLDTVCCPTPFMVGVQMRFQQQVMDSPMEEVLLVNLCEGTFLMSVGDEKDILPPKLQDDILESLGQGINEFETASEQLNEHVSGPFVQFFVKTVGHYASYIKREANGQGRFQERAFYKALTSKTNRRFVKKFVKTQLFSLFIQEAEKSKHPPAGYFQQKILEYEEQKKQKKSREKTVK